MNRSERFLYHAIKADERAGEAATADAKKTWTDIATEYRLYAKMAADNERRLARAPFIILYSIGAMLIGVSFVMLMRSS